MKTRSIYGMLCAALCLGMSLACKKKGSSDEDDGSDSSSTTGSSSVSGSSGSNGSDGDGPAFTSSVADQSISATDTLSVSSAASDADGDSVSYSISGCSGWYSGPSISTAGLVTGIPGVDNAGTCELTVTATADGDSSSQSFDVVVTFTNVAPSITNIVDQAVNAGGTVSDIDLIVDEGGNAVEGDGQTIVINSITSSNQGLIKDEKITTDFVDSGDDGAGVLSIESEPFTPGGTVTITIEATDGIDTVQTTFDVTVSAPVSPPTAYPASKLIAQNTPITFSLVAEDTFAADAITAWHIVSSPPSSEGTLDVSSIPSVTFTPEASFTGTSTFSFFVEDAGGENSNIAEVSIIVDGKAVMIVANPASLDAGETAVRDRIVANNFQVDLVDDDTATSGDESGYNLIVISSGVHASNMATQFKDSSTPILLWGGANFLAHNMASSTGTVSTTQLEISNDAHPLAGGFSNGNLTVYDSSANIAYAVITGNASAVARRVGVASHSMLFVVEKGIQMENSDFAEARRIGYFLPSSGFGTLNSNGETLLDAAIEQALAPPEE